jgi:hypothetical protein
MLEPVFGDLNSVFGIMDLSPFNFDRFHILQRPPVIAVIKTRKIAARVRMSTIPSRTTGN